MCAAAPYQILWVLIPHPSPFTSLSTDPLWAADQEQADIEPFLRGSGKKSSAGNIDDHVTIHSLFTPGTQKMMKSTRLFE